MRLIDVDKISTFELTVSVTEATGNLLRGHAKGKGEVIRRAVDVFTHVLTEAPTVDQWHYPSKGEYPPTKIEVLLCLNTTHGQEIVVGYRDTDSDLHEGGGYVWGWYDFGRGGFFDFVEESIKVIAWQYINPPRKEG